MNGGADPLAGLRPLHQPPPISWWPPAPGWWLSLLFIIILFFFIVRLIRQNSCRRAALRELKSLAKKGQDLRRTAVAVNILLKRYALLCFPKHEVAGLSGKSWRCFLADRLPGKRRGILTSDLSRLFQEDLYRDEIDVDREQLMAFARLWIKSNRPRRQKQNKVAK